MLIDFLTPVSDNSEFESYQLGSHISRYSVNTVDLVDIELAILGVCEGRRSKKNFQTASAPQQIRKELYRLTMPPGLTGKLMDLGDLMAGNTVEDTETALIHIIKYLQSKNIVCLIIGGEKELYYSLYKGMEGVSTNLDITYVSSRLPMLESEVLSQICAHTPNYLFNINALAFQSHYIPSSALDIMNKLGFNQLRLGQLKANLDEVEPLIRNTHVLGFDISAVKQADAPANYYSNPNGIEGDVACKLFWYAGVSDLTKVVAIFEMNPEYDYRNQTAKLSAQMLWYFMDGYINRVNDHPLQHQDFLKYRCSFLDKNPDVIFYKSKRTSRWWMEIPNPRSLNNKNKNVIVPCSYSDYQTAATGDIPDRYLKTISKMH